MSDDVVFDNPIQDNREADFDTAGSVSPRASTFEATEERQRGSPLFTNFETRSLYCLKQSHLPRQLLIRLVQRAEFDYCVLAVIVANAVLIRENEIGGSGGCHLHPL